MNCLNIIMHGAVVKKIKNYSVYLQSSSSLKKVLNVVVTHKFKYF